MQYSGLALGGPVAGKMLTAETPTFEEYYYVPLFGHRGVWLHEDETKGTQPFDDILRILMTTYAEAND